MWHCLLLPVSDVLHQYSFDESTNFDEENTGKQCDKVIIVAQSKPTQTSGQNRKQSAGWEQQAVECNIDGGIDWKQVGSAADRHLDSLHQWRAPDTTGAQTVSRVGGEMSAVEHQFVHQWQNTAESDLHLEECGLLHQVGHAPDIQQTGCVDRPVAVVLCGFVWTQHALPGHGRSVVGNVVSDDIAAQQERRHWRRRWHQQSLDSRNIQNAEHQHFQRSRHQRSLLHAQHS